MERVRDSAQEPVPDSVPVSAQAMERVRDSAQETVLGLVPVPASSLHHRRRSPSSWRPRTTQPVLPVGSSVSCSLC